MRAGGPIFTGVPSPLIVIDGFLVALKADHPVPPVPGRGNLARAAVAHPPAPKAELNHAGSSPLELDQVRVPSALSED